jgi:hypothetical protein
MNKEIRMKILSIGSVVQLKQGERKLMVLNRFPLSNQNGIIGYFDYSGCLYPEGHISQDVFFFNSEDIENIFFEGYIDENEEKFRGIYKEKAAEIPYPKMIVTEN